MSGIKGALKWNCKDSYYSQMNNPTEALLYKLRTNERPQWLESCGPTAAINCLAAMGINIEIVCPGAFRPQPEEVLMDYFNDPRNFTKLEAVRKVDADIPGNRVPQYYPLAVKEVFGVDVAFRWGAPSTGISDHVMAGRPVMVCMERPSHYIALVAYNPSTRNFIYHDSWGARFSDDGGGFSRLMGDTEFGNNLQPYHLVFGLA
jgi:hypothetical protein